MYQRKMRERFLVLLGIVIVATGLGCLYWLTVIRDSQGKFEEIKLKLHLQQNSLRENIELSKDAYLLRIKRIAREHRPLRVALSGFELATNAFPHRRERGDSETFYIHLPRSIVKQGKNTLEVSFSGGVPSLPVRIYLQNYRKELFGGVYILFSDSAYCKNTGNFLPIAFLANFAISLLGVISYGLSGNAYLRKVKHLFYTRGVLLSFCILSFLFLFIWGSTVFGYAIVMTSTFFWISTSPVTAILLLVCIYRLPKALKDRLSKILEFCFAERQFDIHWGLAFGLLIIAVNLWVYWPSFFHLFRHDEWALFFASREIPPGLGFFLKHIDWQLRLPYDRLIFRPLQHAMLAANRVIFDTNYVGPHIVTFVKHIIAVLCLWWLMWQYKPVWISALFALLFSVLLVHIDPVIWPHLDSHITTTIFAILAIIVFRKTVSNRVGPVKGFALTGFLLLLAMLAAEIVALTSFVFFGSYWLFFRDREDPAVKRKNRAVWLVLLVPLLFYGGLYATHLYFAYPDLGMTPQSKMISLWLSCLNMGRSLLLLLAGTLAPFLSWANCADKVYLRVSGAAVALVVVLAFLSIYRGKMLFTPITRGILIQAGLIVSILIVLCFGRASYIDDWISHNMIPSHYVYCISALGIFVIYALLDFNRIVSNEKLRIFAFCILCFLVFNHALRIHQSTIEIEGETVSLKRYFDSVRQFVEAREGEPGFSFKMIDRPPRISPFYWYRETCIDGLFHRYINNENPEYLLEYDYTSENLRHSLYDGEPCAVAVSTSPVTAPDGADYVNSVDIPFKEVSTGDRHFLIGICEVTQKQWQRVMGSNPSKCRDDNRPVENVSYYMVQRFIERLNQIEGGKFYKLPTEKEYSYLAGLFISNPTGVDDGIGKYAWLKDNAGGMTHPVGMLKPMSEGLYDLLGNVWEWTGDMIYYDQSVKPLPGSPLMCFGGSWRDKEIKLADLTTNYPPDFRHEHLGFRLVRKILTTEGE